MIEHKGQKVAIIAKDKEEMQKLVDLAIRSGYLCSGYSSFVSGCIKTYGKTNIGISTESQNGYIAYADATWFIKGGYTIMPASMFLKSYYLIYN